MNILIANPPWNSTAARASRSFQFNDGGRHAAGYKGTAKDCVTRAIAIVTGLPYREVFEQLSEGCRTQRRSKRAPTKKKDAADRVNTNRQWFKEYMARLGFAWTPIMGIGSGCTVHLHPDELPKGRLVVSVSKHMVAVIDGVIHDTHDCSRGGTRCVYGYWHRPSAG